MKFFHCYCFTLGNFFLDQAVNITAHPHIKMCVWFLHRSNWNSIVYIEYFFNDNFIICIIQLPVSSVKGIFFPAVYFIFESALYVYAHFLFGSSGKKQTFLPVFWKFFNSSLFGFKSWLNINILCSIQFIFFYCLFHTIL